MRRPDIRTWIRMVAVASGALMIALAVGEAARQNDLGSAIPGVAASGDPLAAALLRCDGVTPNTAPSADCEAVWAQSRARFLDVPPRDGRR